MEIKLDLRKKVLENAHSYYEKSKKSREKLAGARKALEGTVKKLKKVDEVRGVKYHEIKKPKKREWYEKFRWFFSSDNFLVIGGKDATSNEILIKKYTETNDLVFHADIQGAPFFVIKNPYGKEIPESTLKETAEAAGSYSKAWKSGIGNCDIYYVKPEQVSKTAESGEYIPKGGFMIRGHKNWFKNVELKIAIGFNPDTYEVIGGPVSAIEKNSMYHVVIGIGDKKSKELAEETMKFIKKRTNKEDGMKINAINIDEIQRFIPGNGRILSK